MALDLIVEEPHLVQRPGTHAVVVAARHGVVGLGDVRAGTTTTFARGHVHEERPSLDAPMLGPHDGGDVASVARFRATFFFGGPRSKSAQAMAAVDKLLAERFRHILAEEKWIPEAITSLAGGAAAAPAARRAHDLRKIVGGALIAGSLVGLLIAGAVASKTRAGRCSGWPSSSWSRLRAGLHVLRPVPTPRDDVRFLSVRWRTGTSGLH